MLHPPLNPLGTGFLVLVCHGLGVELSAKQCKSLTSVTYTSAEGVARLVAIYLGFSALLLLELVAGRYYPVYVNKLQWLKLVLPRYLLVKVVILHGIHLGKVYVQRFCIGQRITFVYEVLHPLFILLREFLPLRRHLLKLLVVDVHE